MGAEYRRPKVEKEVKMYDLVSVYVKCETVDDTHIRPKELV